MSVGSASYWGLGLLRGERPLEVAPNNARRLGSINSSPMTLVFVVLNDWAGLSMEGGQALTKRIDIVIGSLDQRLASHVVGHRFLWWAVVPR